MKVSLNPCVLSHVPALPELVALAAEYGFDGVDIGLDQVRALDPADPVGAGRELFERHGVYPSAWGLPLEFRDPAAAAEFEASLAEFPAWVRLAADLGCPRMCTWFMPALPDPETFRRVIGRRLQRAAQLAAEHGVRIGLEWVAPFTSRQGEGLQPFIWRMDQMLEWIEEMGEPNLGLLVDSWHWYHMDGTVADLEALRPEQIVHVHINDAPDRPRDTLGDVTDRVMPGDGVIDLIGFLGALQRVGYRDYLSPEVLNPAIRQDLPDEEALRQAADKTRALVSALPA